MANKKKKKERRPVAGQHPVSPERNRLLCDEHVQFLYSTKDNFIHDKTCKAARQIPDGQLRTSFWYMDERVQCPECMLQAYLRIGAEDRKEYNRYAELYKKMKAKPVHLRELYVTKRMTTEVHYDGIRVNYMADSWLIRAMDDSGTVKLMHNNYKILPDGNRVFTGGYHEQKTGSGRDSFAKVLNVIEGYTYEKHLLAKEKQAAPGKKSILLRILLWLKKKLFG